MEGPLRAVPVCTVVRGGQGDHVLPGPAAGAGLVLPVNGPARGVPTTVGLRYPLDGEDLDPEHQPRGQQRVPTPGRGGCCGRGRFSPSSRTASSPSRPTSEGGSDRRSDCGCSRGPRERSRGGCDRQARALRVEELFTWVGDLARYPAWLDIVPVAVPADPHPEDRGPAWSVDLRGHGPFCVGPSGCAWCGSSTSRR